MTKSKFFKQKYRFWNKSRPKPSILIFVVLFAIAGSYIAYQVLAAPGGSKSNRVALSVVPSSQKIAQNMTLEVEVWMNSYSEPVNAVQANLTYPADKLEFINIDSQGSAFEIQAQASGGNGSVYIARGQIAPVSGYKKVAKVNFLVKANSGKATITFAEGSALVRSTDNIDILSQTINGRYVLTQ